MSDWDIVTEAEPWKVPSPAEAKVRPPTTAFRPSRSFTTAFPVLTQLLGRARCSEVILPSGPHLLFAWGTREHGVQAWLSPATSAVVPEAAAPDHRILLQCFGG